jgi:hypothetical protein
VRQVRQEIIHTVARSYYPSPWDWFGQDVITAAAQPLPAGTCRSCLALMDGRVHDREHQVARTTAGRFLVGNGCPRCQQALETLDRKPCQFCKTREGLRAMPDAVSRAPGLARMIAGDADHACKPCRQFAADTVGRHVHKDQRAASGSTSASTSSARASALRPGFSHGPPTDPNNWRTCDVCIPAAEQYPQSTLTASGAIAQAPRHPHPWHSGLRDFQRWVATGRPKRWPQ